MPAPTERAQAAYDHPSHANDRWNEEQARQLICQLIALRSQMRQLEAGLQPEIERLPHEQQARARNLLHYVALRRNDLRPLQEKLVHWGLSSLGRCESHVLGNVNAVLDILLRLSPPADVPEAIAAPIDFPASQRSIEKHTENLLGVKPHDRAAHIMVTMPSSAAEEYPLVRDLLAHGMTCMRVNTAHDGPEVWSGMIENLRRAQRELGRECRVLMDLAGPKLRTGPLEPGPEVLRWRPRRDPYGRVTVPAQLWLYPYDGQPTPGTPGVVAMPIVNARFDVVQPGDHLRLRDARGRLRLLRVKETSAQGLRADGTRTGYVTPGTLLYLAHKTSLNDRLCVGQVGPLPPLEQSLLLQVGATLVVTSDQQLGRPARDDEQQALREPDRIGCTLPSIFRDVKREERIFFDDGRIEGRIADVQADHIVVQITRAGENGSRLRADKGMNLPDSELQLEALTDKDLQDLQFIVQHADLVAYSFVRRASDVTRLQDELRRLGRADMPIVLKIENRQACERLPSILLAAMRSPAAGVMIARGDLFVEVGYQRLAEMQEEILWMCEAAHMPVIWATQVLEGLAKQGLPSRAEVTDAAMSVRAECVMLNKGPYILEAVKTLDNILGRMQDHQLKKRPLLRRLQLADDLQPLPAGL